MELWGGGQVAGPGWDVGVSQTPEDLRPFTRRLSPKAARDFHGFRAGECLLCGCRGQSPFSHWSGAECVLSHCSGDRVNVPFQGLLWPRQELGCLSPGMAPLLGIWPVPLPSLSAFWPFCSWGLKSQAGRLGDLEVQLPSRAESTWSLWLANHCSHAPKCS